MFLSLKIVNSASIDALMSHSPLRDIIRRRFLFIPAGMKRKDMYSTVHFHVSSFVHVHFSINTRERKGEKTRDYVSALREDT